MIEEYCTMKFKIESDCKILSGNCAGPCSGRTFTNTGKLDFDNIIPSAEIHDLDFFFSKNLFLVNL
tara:strand:+ start:120 stop:317 length:198 start_codon:yes stop_codon:yes gene_type:complete